MIKTEIRETEKEPCPKCGKNEKVACGFGVVSLGTQDNLTEYDCSFWWDETVVRTIPDCKSCPHIWCYCCKASLLADAWAFKGNN